jgi:hypothetical protein
MPQTIDRNGARAPLTGEPRRRNGGPVVLATFESAPIEAQSARLAVAAAADMRSTLFVVDVVRSGRGRRGNLRATAPVGSALAAGLRGTNELARDLGVQVESFRLSSRAPVAALLDLVEDRRPALVVFATDPAVLRWFRRATRRRYRRFIRVLAEHASCLLWTAQEPGARAASSVARPSSRARPAPMRRARPGNAMTIANPRSSQIATTNGKRS